MRKDIAKVLVTTPRVGSWMKNEEVLYRRRERITEDYDGPGRTSMRPQNPRGGYTERKQLNEYLNPLYRFLEKRVGRNWDRVYSEIRQHNRPGSAVGEHIFQHLRDYVRVKLTDVSEHYWSDFFVDKGGILRRSPPRDYSAYARRAPPDSWRKTDDKLLWHVRRDDGCWFEWRLVPPPDDEAALSNFYFRKEPRGFSDGLPSHLTFHGVLRTLSRKDKVRLGL
jgi:hypothetical protein